MAYSPSAHQPRNTAGDRPACKGSRRPAPALKRTNFFAWRPAADRLVRRVEADAKRCEPCARGSIRLAPISEHAPGESLGERGGFLGVFEFDPYHGSPMDLYPGNAP